MIYTGAEYSLESLFQEVKKQVLDENVNNYDGYKDLIDLLVEEKKSYGFFAENEDIEQIKRDLELRWPEVEDAIVGG